MLYLGIDQYRKQLTVSLRDEAGDVVSPRQVIISSMSRFPLSRSHGPPPSARKCFRDTRCYADG